MEMAIFRIEGMNCDGCVSTVKDALGKEPGVQAVSVSLSEAQARVEYDPRVAGEDRLVAAIEKPGFRVVGRKAA